MLIYGDCVCVEVYAVPCKAEGFRFSEAGKDDDLIKIGKGFFFEFCENHANLIVGKRGHMGSGGLYAFCLARRVEADVVQFDGDVKAFG